MTDLTELRRLLEEATPVPWSAELMDRDEEAVRTIEAKDALVVEQLGCACCDYGLAVKYADADLIIGAVNALPDLLDAAEALTAEPTEAEVEAAAEALFEWDILPTHPGPKPRWSTATELTKDMWRVAAHVALKAARGPQ